MAKQYTDSKLHKLEKQSNAGVASAMAMSSILDNQYYKFIVGAGFSNYDGENALAVGIKSRTDNNKHTFSLNGSINSEQKIGTSVGYSFGVF